MKLTKPVFLDVGFGFECGHNIEIGPLTFLRQNAYLGGWDYIRIGAGTSIGRNLSIYTAAHDAVDLQPKGGPVTIGEFCWIGSNVVILPCVTIGDNCIIGAGSLVTCDIPARSIAYGFPAKVMSVRTDISEVVYTGFGLVNRSTKRLIAHSVAPRTEMSQELSVTIK
jgi:acetyltransferase-like isoleucine patch superfamily enzyme